MKTQKILTLVVLVTYFLLLLCLCACGDTKEAGGTTDETQGIAIVDKVIAGVSQKGPFVNGSSVRVYGLNDPSGSTFVGKIASDKGEFKVSGVNLSSQYALLEANGYYRNEVTGEKSKGTIMLYAVTDLSDRENVNVNLLTHLEYERVLNLVSDTLDVREAKKVAEDEILKSFYVDLDVENFEDLDIFNDGEGDAALLAISALLQGDRSEADLSELLANYALDIEKDGEWNDEQTKASIADWSEGKFFEDEYSSIRNNVAGWEMGDVPQFEKYMMNFWWQNYGLGSCTKDRQGEMKQNQNDQSSNRDAFYYCNNLLWERTSDLEKDTYLWKSGKDGDVRSGSIISSNWYVFEESENTWRPATDELDYMKGIGGCTVKRNGLFFVGNDNVQYYCHEREWFEFTYGECNSENEGRVADLGYCSVNVPCPKYVSNVIFQCKNGKWEITDGCPINYWDMKLNSEIDRFCRIRDVARTHECYQKEVLTEYGDFVYECKEDGKWREMTLLEFKDGPCLESNEGMVIRWDSEEYYICQDEQWISYDKSDAEK